MLQLTRLSALVSIVFVALGALGNTSSSVALGSLSDGAHVCTSTTPLDNAIDTVDYAEAVLIANDEMYFGLTSEEITAQIDALPLYIEADGISFQEEESLNSLLQLGRQLAYARAAEALELQLETGPEGIRIASVDDGISYELLEALRGGC